MLALIGPRGNGRSKKLAQWAIASGGVIIVLDRRRAERFEHDLHVPAHQIATLAQIRDRTFNGQDTITLYAIDDVEYVIQDLLGGIHHLPQLVAFHGGAMTL